VKLLAIPAGDRRFVLKVLRSQWSRIKVTSRCWRGSEDDRFRLATMIGGGVVTFGWLA